MDVWHEHQLVKSYPLDSLPVDAPFVVEAGRLHIGGDVYEVGQWSGVLSESMRGRCCFITPNPDCPNCNGA